VTADWKHSSRDLGWGLSGSGSVLRHPMKVGRLLYFASILFTHGENVLHICAHEDVAVLMFAGF